MNADYFFLQDQYIFIHDALTEYIENGGETEIKAVDLPQYLDDLMSYNKVGKSLLERQYKVIYNTQTLKLIVFNPNAAGG